MGSILDSNLNDRFVIVTEEIFNKQLQVYEAITDATIESCQSHKLLLKTALDACLDKCTDDETLFEKMQTFKWELKQQNASLKDRQCVISGMMAEIQQKEMQRGDIIQKIEMIKEEQAKRKTSIESQQESNKESLRNLQKARLFFQEHLGLEIRTILGKTQSLKGEKLQFIFRNINPSDEDSAYIVTMGIKEDGSYQIVSSDPMLECLPVLEHQLQETNKLPAFLANVRKEFISLARR